MKHVKMGFKLILAFHPEMERKYSSQCVSHSTQCSENETVRSDRGMTEGASPRQTLPDVTTINSGQNTKKQRPDGAGKETKAGQVWRGGESRKKRGAEASFRVLSCL